jgi:pimeloyl-ACP methyl ester carboxylesterase
MPENTNFVGFGQPLAVELPSAFGSPIFKKFEDQDLYSRSVSLNQIGESFSQVWDGRQVWVVSHGWNENYDAYGRDLGIRIKNAKPQDIVLAVDWENVARTTIIGDPDYPSDLNDAAGIFAGAPFYAATWVGVVADAIAQQLADWGVKNEAINLVGHSLGTLLNNEISYRLMNTYASQTGGSKVKSITALEPPSENFLARPIDERFTNGYVYPRETASEIFENIDPENLQYKNLAEFSRAFLGRASIAGNADSASLADESIAVDYNSIDPLQHNWIHLTFQRLFTGERKLARDLFNLDDYQPHSEFQKDAFAANYKSVFEGILLATSSSEILGFLAKAISNSGFDRIVYGTDGADQIDLYQINEQFVDDGEGGLPIFGSGDLSGSNLAYLGEGDDDIDLSSGAESGNDRIFGEAGNDRINAGDGDDELYSGAGNDILAGEEGTDTAFFTGNFADYEWIELVTVGNANSIAFRDKRSNSANNPNDGEDTLRDIEFAQFADVRIPLIGIKNGMFEDDLDHWNVEGDAQAIDQLGSISTLQGQKMAFISTAASFSSISQSFFVPTFAQGLTFTYNVISTEPLEFVGTEFDDQFEVLLTSTSPPSQSVSIIKETINTSSWQPIDGVSLPDDDTVYQVGTRTVLFDLSPFKGQTVNLVFKVFDRSSKFLTEEMKATIQLR